MTLNFKKNSLFVFIVLTGIVYFASVVLLLKDLIHSCVSEMFTFFGISNFEEFLYNSLTNTSLLFNTVALSLLGVALIKIMLAILKTATDYLATKNLLLSLKVHNRGEYFVARSSKAFVFTHGLLNPRIIISSTLMKKLSRKEFQTIILHEKMHTMSLDPLKKLIVKFINNSMFGLFGMNYLLKQYEQLTELAADEFAIRKVESTKPLLSSIYKITKLKNLLFISQFNDNNQRLGFYLGTNNLFLKKSLRIFLSSIILIGGIVIYSIATKPFNKCNDITLCINRANAETINQCYVYEDIKMDPDFMSKDQLQSEK